MFKIRLNLFKVLLASLALYQSLWCQTQMQLQEQLERAAKENPLRFGANIEAYTNAQNQNQASATSYTLFMPNLTYVLGNGHSLRTTFFLEKQLSGFQEERIQRDSRITYNIPRLMTGTSFFVNGQFSLIAPISQNSQMADDTIGGFDLAPIIIMNTSGILKGSSLVYIPRYRRLFHEFTTDRSGQQLVNQSLVHIFAFDYSINDKWLYSMAYVHVNSWRYNGLALDDAYFFNNQIMYNISSRTNVYFGVGQLGSYSSRAGATDQTFQPYDARIAEFFLGFGLL